MGARWQVGRRGARRSTLLAATAAVVLGVGGCGTTSSAATSAADTAYIASVHQGAPDISAYRSDVALIRMGHAACDGFRGGVSYQQLADRLVLIQGRHPVPTGDLGAIITSAVSAYCPQYQSLVQ